MQSVLTTTSSARFSSTLPLPLRLRASPSLLLLVNYYSQIHSLPRSSRFHFSSPSSACNDFAFSSPPSSLSHQLRNPLQNQTLLRVRGVQGGSNWRCQWRYKSTLNAEREVETGAEAGKNTNKGIKAWSFEEIQSLSQTPQKGLIIIDVREPTELQTTGRIPTAFSMPIISNPNAIHLPPGEFRARFGFDKPGLLSSSSSSGREEQVREDRERKAAEVTGQKEEKEEKEEKVKEVVFYCLAGVRSRKAAEMAMAAAADREGWAGIQVGDWGGGWSEWEARGGKVERG